MRPKWGYRIPGGILIGRESHSIGASRPLDELPPFQRQKVQPIDGLPTIVAREPVHALRLRSGRVFTCPSSKILEQALMEGGADFKAEMHGTDVSRWLYSQDSAAAPPGSATTSRSRTPMTSWSTAGTPLETRLHRLPLIALLAVVACAGVRGGVAPDPEAALQRYNQALLRVDAEAIAAMYTPDGELGWADDPPIRGPAAIAAHLRHYQAYRVEDSRMTTVTGSLNGASARQEGKFWQRTRLPDGKTVEASGRFTAEWRRAEDGTWRLRRLVTRPP